MKWILILLIFHGGGAPAVVKEEFTLLSDCLAAKAMIENSIDRSMNFVGFKSNAIISGGCIQKL